MTSAPLTSTTVLASATPTFDAVVTADKQQQQPSLVHTPSSAILSQPDVKDQRAYEHARQRVHKAADFVKQRSQKTTKVKASDRAPPASWVKTRLTADTQEGLFLINQAKTDRTAVLGRAPVPVDYPAAEASLADLIMVKRPRTKKRADSDFEVIPHVRSVIVLDDSANTLDIDEPWEHIYNEKDELEVKALPSYAAILASGK